MLSAEVPIMFVFRLFCSTHLVIQLLDEYLLIISGDEYSTRWQLKWLFPRPEDSSASTKLHLDHNRRWGKLIYEESFTKHYGSASFLCHFDFY